jgi:hypothetical protein
MEERLAKAGAWTSATDEGIETRDPAGNRVRLKVA